MVVVIYRSLCVLSLHGAVHNNKVGRVQGRVNGVELLDERQSHQIEDRALDKATRWHARGQRVTRTSSSSNSDPLEDSARQGRRRQPGRQRHARPLRRIVKPSRARRPDLDHLVPRFASPIDPPW